MFLGQEPIDSQLKSSSSKRRMITAVTFATASINVKVEPLDDNFEASESGDAERQSRSSNNIVDEGNIDIPRDDLPVDVGKIDPAILDLIPEEYFDVQHNFFCSCIGCRLLMK